MALCKYVPFNDGFWKCKVCGDTPRTPRATPTIRVCRANLADHSPMVSDALASIKVEPSQFGLGDITAAALDRIGITKERVEAWWGAPCDCKDRQDRLNKLGEKVAGWLRVGRAEAESH